MHIVGSDRGSTNGRPSSPEKRENERTRKKKKRSEKPEVVPAIPPAILCPVSSAPPNLTGIPVFLSFFLPSPSFHSPLYISQRSLLAIHSLLHFLLLLTEINQLGPTTITTSPNPTTAILASSSTSPASQRVAVAPPPPRHSWLLHQSGHCTPMKRYVDRSLMLSRGPPSPRFMPLPEPISIRNRAIVGCDRSRL